jgi:hypothetical protein
MYMKCTVPVPHCIQFTDKHNKMGFKKGFLVSDTTTQIGWDQWYRVITKQAGIRGTK